MSFTCVGDVVLHYRVGGRDSGPTLVFINSLGTDLGIWTAVIEEFDTPARLIRYHKRGHGLSDVTPAPYTISSHTADLAGLLNRLSVEAAIVCGVSIGGMIAQAFASARPDLVQSLTFPTPLTRLALVRAGTIELTR